MDSPSVSVPQTIEPGLELVETQGDKIVHYDNSYGLEVVDKPLVFYPPPVQQRLNPFRLSPLVFGITVGIMTAIVVGLGLGGGLGGALVSCENQKSKLQALSNDALNLTSGATMATNYKAASMLDIKTLALDCPAINGTTIKDKFNQKYTYTCGIDLGTLPSSNGDNITDIACIVAYTVEDCINACSAINFQTYIQRVEGGPSCKSVSWFGNAKEVVGVSYGNCWLKNEVLAPGQPGKNAANAVSAQLTS